MASLNTIVFYLDVINKKLVNVSGSPTSIPDLYYGDYPTVTVYPVVPISSNPNQGYTAFSANGYTMDITCAGKPNATSPPTPFAQLATLTWNGPSAAIPNSFSGDLDLTQNATGLFIGANQSATAWMTFDMVAVASPNKRTTFLQPTFNIVASNDAVTPIAGGATVTALTLAYLQNTFLLKYGAPGDGPILRSSDQTKSRQIILQNDGNVTDVPV